jgi:site-specific DNA recombinase
MANLRTGIYARISLDPKRDKTDKKAGGEGVARQDEDCRQLAERRGWTVVEVFTDNSISAAGKKFRPAFAAMLDSINRGDIDAVVAWSLDRLARNARDRLALVEACQKHGTIISLVKGSDMDPTTASGRMVIGILGEVAQMEIELKSERQTVAARQRSQLGRPPLGVRLNGYTPKGELVHDEAELVRRIFKMFSTGESLRSIATTLTCEGISTRRGRPWNPSSIRGILVNPRYAGRAVYQGEVTDSAVNWEPLVTGDVFDVVQAKLSDPRRVSNREGTDRKHLGSGIYRCADCGQSCSSFSGGRYRCKSGHINRSQKPVDDWVTTVVAAYIRKEHTRIAERMRADESPSAALVAELDALTARRKKTEADYDLDLIDGKRYKAKMERIAAEAALVQQKMSRSSKSAALAQVMASDDPPQAFLNASLMGQRAIIDTLVAVRLHKGTRGSKAFDRDTVEVTPK